MPGLRVLAGSSLDALVPITDYVNTNKPCKISSRLFEGQVVANIKGFTDCHGKILNSEYFEREDRQGITWSIQVQGRFLQPYSADDILFGNTFDRPLHLPWGSGAALKFMSYVDPTLEHDLTSRAKPWALSPLISTMPHFAHAQLLPPRAVSRSSSDSSSSESSLSHSPTSLSAPPSFPPRRSLKDDTTQLHRAQRVIPSPTNPASASPPSSASSSSSSISGHSSFSGSSSGGSRGSSKSHKFKNALTGSSKIKHIHSARAADAEGQPFSFQNANQRRSFFSVAENRQAVQFGPKDVITMDFCYGFLEFSPTLSLRLPGGISFDLMRYWDGQPVRFVCCERKRSSGSSGSGSEGEDAGEPWGRVFWCVAIEMCDETKN